MRLYSPRPLNKNFAVIGGVPTDFPGFRVGPHYVVRGCECCNCQVWIGPQSLATYEGNQEQYLILCPFCFAEGGGDLENSRVLNNNASSSLDKENFDRNLRAYMQERYDNGQRYANTR